MDAKKKKSKKRKWIMIGAVAAAAVFTFVFVSPVFSEVQRAGAASMAQMAAAEYGSIEISVTGSGTLDSNSTQTIQAPAGIEIDTVYVEAGDEIAAGDVLADVNPASVSSMIEEVQSELAAIDASIDDSAGDTDQAEITATVSGRVKQILAEEGNTVEQAINEHGALMVLSVDGLMHVVLNDVADGLATVGDDVDVALSDGSMESGTVAEVSGGTVKITIDDKDGAYGEEVSVYSEDGSLLGSGALDINAPLEVVHGSGTLSDIEVELNEYADAGDALITLVETAASQSYSELISTRRKYTELLRELQSIAATGTLVSETNGIVSEVLISALSSSSAQSGTDGSAGGMSPVGYSQAAENSEQSEGIITLYDNGSTAAASDGKLSLTLLSVGADTSGIAAAEAEATDTNTQDDATPAGQQIGGNIQVALSAPAAKGMPQTSINPGAGYTGTVVWSPEAMEFEAGTVYTATVTLTAASGYGFAADVNPVVPGAEVVAGNVQNTGSTLTFSAVFPETESMDAQAGSMQQNQTTQSNQFQSQAAQSSGSMGGSYSTGGTAVASSAASSASSASGTGDSGTTDTELWQDAFSVLSTDSIALTVSADELDVLSLAAGQQATVVLDALPDEVFTGTVTKISNSGTAQSGVTTYPVTILLDIPDGVEVKTGMNATATIVTEVSENTLVIPMAAMQEMGGEQFVYIASSETQAGDEEEGAMGERRVITTGLSDGTYVEVLSGLEEGETVTYIQTESDESSDEVMFMMQGGGMMQGSMPDFGGGERPSFNESGGMGAPPQ
ncbi:MAG: hypothetical protein ACOYJB_07055 [Christensenellaceae bacterium]